MVERKKIDTYLDEVESKLNELENIKHKVNAGVVELIFSKRGCIDSNWICELEELGSLEADQKSLMKDIMNNISEVDPLIIEYLNNYTPSNYYVLMEFRCNVLTRFDNALLKAELLGV